MAFDETLAARIRTAVARKKGIEEKFPEDVQAILENGPQSATLLPNANETISYMMPAFKQHGILVYFAGWKNES
jgi:uncharacterized protein YdhG (YjbR/CyaY superfamily)